MANCSEQRGSPPFFVGDSEDGMAHIFSYLNFKDLSACRLVSKFWFDVSLRFWVAEAGPMKLSEKRTTGNGDDRWAPAMTIAKYLKRIHVDGDADEAGDDSKCKNAGIRQLRDFWLEFKEIPPAESKLDKLKLQFKRLSSKCRSFGGGSKEKDKKCSLLKGLLASRGSWITSLTLDHFAFPDRQTFEEVMYAKFTPELKDLMILNFRCDYETQGTLPQSNSCEDDDEEFQNSRNRSTTKITSLYILFKKGRLPVGWTDFLEHYPSLKDLEIYSGIGNNENWDILDAISQLRENDRTRLELTKLKIVFPRTLFKSPERLLAFYQQAQLPLETLDIEPYENNTREFVSDLVNLHASFLKDLIIANIFPILDQGWSPPFAVEALQKLHIYGRPVFRSLGFLSRFPNLESLIVQTSDLVETYCNLISSTTEEEMDGVVAASLTRFDYEYEEICGAEEIRKIQTWMPNLKWLNIAVMEDGLAAVQLLLPQLETIKLRRHDSAAAVAALDE